MPKMEAMKPKVDARNLKMESRRPKMEAWRPNMEAMRPKIEASRRNIDARKLQNESPDGDPSMECNNFSFPSCFGPSESPKRRSKKD
jgi:hypothetical protein